MRQRLDVLDTVLKEQHHTREWLRKKLDWGYVRFSDKWERQIFDETDENRIASILNMTGALASYIFTPTWFEEMVTDPEWVKRNIEVFHDWQNYMGRDGEVRRGNANEAVLARQTRVQRQKQ